MKLTSQAGTGLRLAMRARPAGLPMENRMASDRLQRRKALALTSCFANLAKAVWGRCGWRNRLVP